MRRLSCLIAVAILLLAPIGWAFPAEIAPNLLEEVASAGEDEQFPVIIRLTEQADGVQMRAFSLLEDKQQKRSRVCEYLQFIASSSQAPLLSLLEEAEAEGRVAKITSLWIINAVSCYADGQTIISLSENEDIAYISYDYSPISLLCEVTWGVEKVGADDVWQMPPSGYTGEGVVVAVVDTGCNRDHLDLTDHIWVNEDEIPGNGIDDDDNGYIDDTWGWNFMDDNNDPSDTHGEGTGHGTHVAGTIASDGSAGSNCGVAPDASLMVLKINTSFDLYQTQTFLAFQYALDNGADIINLSSGLWHSLEPDRVAWRWACINTQAGGTLIVAAAGNEQEYASPDSIRTPGDVPEVLTVGGTSNTDVIFYDSSHGPVEWDEEPPFDDYPYPPGLIKPNVVAPGGRELESDPYDENHLIKSCAYNQIDGYYLLEGTSMATPHVTGLAALLLQANYQLSPADIIGIIESTALDLGEIGKDNYYGSGRIQAVPAVQEALDRLTPSGGKTLPFSLFCFPNPVTETATIVFFLPQEGEAVLKLYDISGRMVRELGRGNFSLGEHRLDFVADGLSSGVYILSLQALDQSAGVRVVLLR